MTDKPIAVNVREALGAGGGITPRHGGPLRRPTEAAFDGIQAAGKTTLNIDGEEEEPMHNADFLGQTRDRKRKSTL